MKIHVKHRPDSNEFIELEVDKKETIGSIKRKVVAENLKLDKYRDYEYYDGGIERRCEKLVLAVNPFNEDHFTVGDLKDSQTIDDIYNSLINRTIYQALYPRQDLRFILSDPTITFEFISSEMTMRVGRSKNVYNICHLKQCFTDGFAATCSIFLKKRESSEYLLLEDNESIPFKDIFVKFDSNIKPKNPMKTTLCIPYGFEGYSVTEVQLLNLQVHSQSPTSLKEHFECLTILGKGPPSTPHKYFIATGAIAGLFSIIANSFISKSYLAETTMSSLCAVLPLKIGTINFIANAVLGTTVGSLFGLAASYLYGYSISPACHG